MLNKSTFFPLKIKICVQGLLLELDRIILHMLCIHFSWCQSSKICFPTIAENSFYSWRYNVFWNSTKLSRWEEGRDWEEGRWLVLSRVGAVPSNVISSYHRLVASLPAPHSSLLSNAFTTTNLKLLHKNISNTAWKQFISCQLSTKTNCNFHVKIDKNIEDKIFKTKKKIKKSF